MTFWNDIIPKTIKNRYLTYCTAKFSVFSGDTVKSVKWKLIDNPTENAE